MVVLTEVLAEEDFVRDGVKLLPVGERGALTF